MKSEQCHLRKYPVGRKIGIVNINSAQLWMVAALLGKGRFRVALINWQYHSFCSSNASSTWMASH
jgi:hypothetical protein